MIGDRSACAGDTDAFQKLASARVVDLFPLSCDSRDLVIASLPVC